jgi:nicotinamidase/pyrazinamidase
MSTVFVDVDTQLDFMLPAGALYVPGAEAILPAVVRLNRLAAERGLVLVSTADAHTENDPEFRDYPPHCVAGTTGQHKVSATLLERRVVIANRESPLNLQGASQIVVEKQTTNAFASVNFEKVIAALDPSRIVVYGVVTEICVLAAASGLLRMGKRVTLVTDAIQALEEAQASAAIAELTRHGATFATTAQISQP